MGSRTPTVPDRVSAHRLPHDSSASQRFARGSTATQLPEQFGKYSILGHLATGGMAEVYVARQTGLHGFQKTVVLKRVRPEMMDGETIESFRDEARLVAELEHPNIAQVYEIGEVDSSCFFAMEYVNGADLRQLMEAAVTNGTRVSLGDAVFIITAVCAALHHAHERCDFDGKPLSIVHRDVSPSNVLVSHEGAIKVCDFGIAKARNRSTETVRGAIKGKFAYMSPEQCRCQPLDRRSDIFSIGILLYELSTLSRAFAAPSEFDLLRAIIEQPVEPPSKRVADYPSELERIVLRALEKDPAERYPTAQAMQRDLEAFARESKLAMSSINIAALMDTLFDRRIEGWLRHRSGGRPFDDDELPELVLDTGESDNAFHASGTDRDVTFLVDVAPAVLAPATRKRTARWLVGAVVALIVAGGAAVADVATSPAEPDASMFEMDAREIAAAVEGAVHTLRLRGDSVVSTPILRAAIDTDAATIADLARSEKLITPAPNEVIEIVQQRDGHAQSMLRLPADAPAIDPIAGRDARVVTDGKTLTVIVARPIANAESRVAGTLAIAAPVDLAPISRLFAGRAAAASIDGLAAPLPLVGSREAETAPPLRLPIALPEDAGSPPLTLVVVPAATVRSLAWASLLRNIALALALAAFAGYLTARVRARR